MFKPTQTKTGKSWCNFSIYPFLCTYIVCAYIYMVWIQRLIIQLMMKVILLVPEGIEAFDMTPEVDIVEAYVHWVQSQSIRVLSPYSIKLISSRSIQQSHNHPKTDQQINFSLTQRPIVPCPSTRKSLSIGFLKPCSPFQVIFLFTTSQSVRFNLQGDTS